MKTYQKHILIVLSITVILLPLISELKAKYENIEGDGITEYSFLEGIIGKKTINFAFFPSHGWEIMSTDFNTPKWMQNSFGVPKKVYGLDPTNFEEPSKDYSSVVAIRVFIKLLPVLILVIFIFFTRKAKV